MEKDQLVQLLSQPEGPNLEFKREFYKNYFDGGDVSKNQKGEFIKDILSLANGDASTAWDTAYLIFGVGDETGIDGQRKLYDVVDKLPDRSSIHQMVNGICDPQLEYIETDIILIDNKRVFVITIPPSPYLYETTKKLSTTSQIFSQHVVFIRRGSSIGIANAKERSAILQLKQVRYLAVVLDREGERLDVQRLLVPDQAIKIHR